jgi:thymidine kinase
MLNLIIGPMFSGKSTELLRRYRRYKLAGKKCLLVKHVSDTRYSDGTDSMIITHDNIKYSAIKCSQLEELVNIVENQLLQYYDVILIDEIQFYSDAHLCDKWANLVTVEACGLSGDFERKPFEQISNLIPKADNITFLTAICKLSGQEAPFTKRTSNEKTKIVIGGADCYQAVSRDIYML